MKSFLSSLRKLETALEIKSERTAAKNHVQLLMSWLKKSRAINKKCISGTSLSVYTSLLTIGSSIGIGIVFNPQRSWAGSTCVGTYSSRSGVAIDPTTGQVVTSTTNSVIGYFNSITNSYVPLVNYTGGNNINAIAIQPSTGNVFFVNRATGKIIVYNPNTNTQTTLTGGLSVAGPPASTTIIGATFNASGNLYVYYSNKTLVEVNPTSGNAVGSAITISGIPGITGRPATPTLAGIAGGTTNGDIAIGTNGVLYALGDTSGTGAAGVNDYTSRLYAISISGTTATATPVVNSNITGLGGSAANGLAIDPATGRFYISSSLGTYELNPATNSAVQLTNALGTNDLAACGAPTPDLPTITKAFSPNNIVGLPANSTLTLTLSNTNQVPIFLIAPLVDSLPTGLTVRSPNGLGGTCLADTANSNKVTAVANSSSITLSDGLKVPAGGCTVTVNVAASTVGSFVNTIAAGALKTTAGNSLNAATDTLSVRSTASALPLTCPVNTVSIADLNAGATDDATTITYTNAGGGGRTMTVQKLSGSNTISGPSPNIYPLGAGTPVGGIWLGSDDRVTRSWFGRDTETYEVSFDGDITALRMAFSAINGNTDGIEHIKILNVYNAAGADITATTSFGFVDSTPTGFGSLAFFTDTRTLEPTTYSPNLTAGGTYGNSNGTITLQNTAGMRRVVFQRIEPGNPSSTNTLGPERSNGVGMGPVSYCSSATAANVKLIKRITAINGDRVKNPNDLTKPLNQVLNNPATANDDPGVNWPNTSSFSLLGAYQPGLIKPGDEIEYTIYFLNASGADANAVKICDRIVGSQQFVADAYGPGQDIEYKLGANATQYLTRASLVGIDRAEFNSSTNVIPGCPAPTITGTNNGTVTINVTGTGSTKQVDLLALPGATAPGVPTDSYGYFRFKVKVNS